MFGVTYLLKNQYSVCNIINHSSRTKMCGVVDIVAVNVLDSRFYMFFFSPFVVLYSIYLVYIRTRTYALNIIYLHLHSFIQTEFSYIYIGDAVLSLLMSFFFFFFHFHHFIHFHFQHFFLLLFRIPYLPAAKWQSLLMFHVLFFHVQVVPINDEEWIRSKTTVNNVQALKVGSSMLQLNQNRNEIK